MRKTTFWIFTVFFAAAISQISAAEKMRMTPGDINDLELPSFDEKTGFKEWEVFGKNVKYVSDDQILIKEARLDIFSLNDSHKKNATFSSPRATLSRITKSAKSDAPLFVSGESFKLKGLDWKWSGVKRFVSLSKDVDVEFEGREEEGVKKIRIKSDYASMDYSGDENKFYFEKNVSVNGDDFSILSERLSTQAPKRSENSGFKSLNGISASGRVKMRYQSGISASAESVKVNPESGLANMEGNPEIVNEDTRDSVWGDKIVFKKSDSSAAAYSSADGKARARAIIHASADSPQKGELKPTAIFADTITMTRGKDSDVFLFAGNVVVENPEFKAFAKRLEAVSKKSEGGRQDILKISGFDGVKFLKDGQIAQADKIEIFPRNMEVWLNGGAKLEDPERGVRLFADRISMLHNDGRATAFSSSPKKPVRLEIDQSDSLGLEASPRPVAITAKTLSSQKDGDGGVFTFSQNVKIVSQDIEASCAAMDVYAQKSLKGGKSHIKKIEAFDNVKVRQKGSEADAQVARIFPSVDTQADGARTTRKMMQLERSPENPKIRPKMTLPEIRNIGLDSLPANTKPQKTAIESDSQYFVSGMDYDTYVFENNVKIIGTGFEAECEKVEVLIKPDKRGKREVFHINLSKSVEVRQGKRIARAGRADIHPAEEMIALSDSPSVLNEDGSRAEGTRMIYTRGKKSISIENPIITLPKFKK